MRSPRCPGGRAARSHAGWLRMTPDLPLKCLFPMNQTSHVDVAYFSDVLCVWAYAAEARVQELVEQLGAEVRIERHYFGVFGDTLHKVGVGWKDRGGYEGFAKHVHEVAADFGHVETHAELWKSVCPASSMPAHLWLKAAQLSEDAESRTERPSDRLAWALRMAFFRDARNIAHRDELAAITADCGLDVDAVEAQLHSGEANAALTADERAREKYRIEGSPTFVLNNGRQKLYGNVGYRVLEANVRELLREPGSGAASWC